MILHQFSHQTDVSLKLSARARQFSSFILMVGKIASADTFEPTHAIIVQNKDDVLVPLLLEQIPSAKAFRAMQLESTLFGVCVVEIKPQLERLLNLPPDALTQDLMELFIVYQVPSDLLSFDGKAEAPAHEKVDAVKRHVKALQDMIADSKKKELEEKQQEAKYAVAQSYAESAPVELYDAVALESAPVRSRMAPVKMKRRAMPSAAAAPKMLRETAVASSSVAKSIAVPSPQPATPSPSNDVPASKKPRVEGAAEEFVDEEAMVDYTKVPAELDAKFDKLDKEGAVRPTKIEPGTSWRKKFQKALLAQPSETSLHKDDLREQKNKAFDLLDALTKSGALSIEQCQLHVVIVSTHCFDKTLMR